MKSLLLIIIHLITISRLSGFSPVHHEIIISYGSLSITAIAECDMFIYIGTTHGLIRQNRKKGNAIHITQENSMLPSNNITSIVCLKNGYTIIGTPKGILVWDNYTYFLVNKENSNLPDNHITALALDSDENIWVGSFNSGLFKYLKVPFVFSQTVSSQIGYSNIYSISVDKHDVPWVSFLNGEYGYFHSAGWEIYSAQQLVESIHPLNAGTFLLNIHNRGQYLYRETYFQVIHADSLSNQVTCSYHNSQYSRLVICNQSGIFVFDYTNISLPPHYTSYEDFINLVSRRCHLRIFDKRKRDFRL